MSVGVVLLACNMALSAPERSRISAALRYLTAT